MAEIPPTFNTQLNIPVTAASGGTPSPGSSILTAASNHLSSSVESKYDDQIAIIRELAQTVARLDAQAKDFYKMFERAEQKGVELEAQMKVLHEKAEQSDIKIAKLEAQLFKFSKTSTDLSLNSGSTTSGFSQRADFTVSQVLSPKKKSLKVEKLEDMDMKDVVPYTPQEKNLIESLTKVDFADTIPPDRVEGAEFVKGKSMEWGRSSGIFTGWWKEGKANGRGTWLKDSGSIRADAVWKDGCLSGKGRLLKPKADRVEEGDWVNDAAATKSSVKIYDKRTEESMSTSTLLKSQ